MHPDIARQLAAERHADFRREQPRPGGVARAGAAVEAPAWRAALRRSGDRRAHRHVVHELEVGHRAASPWRGPILTIRV